MGLLYLYKSKDGSLQTVKSAHRISVDILQFVCSRAELVGKTRKARFGGFVQRLVSGGRQVCVVVASTTDSTTAILRLTKIIRSGITFVSRKVISRRFL